jgi:hypothetical protein
MNPKSGRNKKRIHSVSGPRGGHPKETTKRSVSNAKKITETSASSGRIIPLKVFQFTLFLIIAVKPLI